MTRPAIRVVMPDTPVKLPGSSQEAEQSLLGSCLLKYENIPLVASRLRPGDFEDGFVATCVETLIYLHGEGRKPSMLSLLSELDDPDGSAKRFLSSILSDALHSPPLPVDDPIDLISDRAIRRGMAEAGRALTAAATSFSKAPVDAGTEAIEAIDAEISRRRQARRMSFDAAGVGDAVFSFLDSEEKLPTTGFRDLDAVIGGYPIGQLTIFAARPGMGKTAYAASSLRAAARAGHGCAFFSLEMTAQQLGGRLMTDDAYCSGDPVLYQNIMRRNLSERDRGRLVHAKERIKALPMRIEENSDITISELAMRCRKIAAEFERDGKSLDIVFVDHMGLLKPSTRYSGNRTQEMSDISNGLRVLAKDLNVAVVALCQLNRGVEGRENKRPTKADLRDSGEIEEDASNVILLYRPLYYLAQQKPETPEDRLALADAMKRVRHKLDLIVDKNRNGEAPVTVELFVDIGANAVRNKSFG